MISITDATKGRVAQPPRLLVYGSPGCGKSTLAAAATKPIVIDVDGGTQNIDCTRTPTPTTFEELLALLAELATVEHDYRTLVVDTLDAVESMVWGLVVADYNRTSKGAKVTTAGDIPYGRGMESAVDYWRRFLASLERCWSGRRMTVILIDHSTIRTFKNPSDEDYQRIEPKIDRKASALLRSWCDAVLLADFQTEVATNAQTKRSKGVSTGQRVLRTEYAASHDAKNRYALPPELPLSWTALAAGIKAGMTGPAVEAAQE